MPKKFRNREEFPQRGNQDGKPSYTPYLLIPYNATDSGDRPLQPDPVTKELPCFYVSPHILVSPVDKFGNVVAGQEVTITARVFNGSKLKSALPLVTVEFFVFDSFLAFTSANSLFKATIQSPKSIDPKGYIQVTSPKPWTPITLENGHPCVIVQCSTPEEGTDGLKFPFSRSRIVMSRSTTRL